MAKNAVLFISLGILLLRPVSAEERPLTIQEAVSAALQHNPEIVGARHALEEAKGRRLQAEARPEPRVAMSTEGVPFSLEVADTTEINLGLELPIEFPGKRPLRARIGCFDQDIAFLELDRTCLIIAARVKKAYWKAVLSDRTVTSLENLADLLDAIIESSRIRYQAGTAAYGDVLRARVERARLQNEAIETRQGREAALAELALLLGSPDRGPFSLTSDLTFVPFDRALEDVKAAARATRPSLRIAALRSEQAETASALASKNRLPDFSLGLFFPSIRFNAWGIGFGFNLPLSRSRTEGERLEAAARYAASAAAVEARSKRLDMELEVSYAAVQAAADQVRLFERELLVEMEEELRSGLMQYQYGKMESYSLLDLYRTYAAANLERLKALYLYLSGLAGLEAAGEEN
jgi:outer membrane protein TolC